MLWIKSFHIVMVVAWFAGLFYLPRIYVNLAEEQNTESYKRLIGMASRLYRFITPLAILAVATGLVLMLVYGIGLGQGWMHTKLVAVLILIVYHFICGYILKQFKLMQNDKSHIFYRWFNEIPVFILLAVVVLVVVKPF